MAFFVGIWLSKSAVIRARSNFKPGFHKANFDHDSDQFWFKTKRLAGRMTAQPRNRFVCVVAVAFAVNGNQASVVIA